MWCFVEKFLWFVFNRPVLISQGNHFINFWKRTRTIRFNFRVIIRGTFSASDKLLEDLVFIRLSVLRPNFSITQQFPRAPRAGGNSSLSQAGSSGLTCLSLTDYAYELRNNSSSSCVLMSIYCVSTTAGALQSPLQSRPDSTRAVLQMRREIRGRSSVDEWFCLLLLTAARACCSLSPELF